MATKTQPKPKRPSKKPQTKKSVKKPNYVFLKPQSHWTTLSMMVYGPPGCGKTYLMGSATRDDRFGQCLLLDNDGGSRTLLAPAVSGIFNLKRLSIVRILNFNAYTELYAFLTAHPQQFQTVIIDNLGEAHNLAMQQIMQKVLLKDPSRDPEIPGQREYGIARIQIRRLVQFFNSLKINVLITAHASLDKDDLDKVTYIRPALAGKLAFEVPGVMGIVGYYFPRREKTTPGEDPKIVRELFFQPVKRFEAKDQSSALGVKLENPRLSQIADIVGIVNSNGGTM